jgi:4-hydroxy-2-oxoheptanedioate aldolase
MAYVFQPSGTPRRSVPQSLGQKLAGQQVVHGAACYLGSPIIAEMLAQTDLDYVYIDQQHGIASPDVLVEMIRAVDRTEIAPIVRVRSNDSGLIGQALDAGADGIIVPMVNSRADAERAVAACRYGPVGTRSYGPIRSSMTRGGTLDEVNKRVSCFIMIETRDGLAQLDAIARTPGLAGIYIGQADLAVSLGLDPELRIQPGEHEAAINAILHACQANGIAASLSGDPKDMSQRGFRMITIGSDQGFVSAGISRLQQATLARNGN